MTFFVNLWKNFFGASSRLPDFISLGISLGLFCIGCLFIYGIGQHNSFISNVHWQQQLIFGCLGGMCCLVLSLIDYHVLGKISGIFYVIAVILLILIFIPSLGKTINNARCWLAIPGIPFSVQPSEFTKPATLLFLAWVASQKKLYPWVNYIFLVAIVAVPVLLIFKQPDLGTVLVFGPLVAVIFFLKGIQWKFIITFIIIISIFIPFSYKHLASYQKERIDVALEVLKKEFGQSSSSPYRKRKKEASYQIEQTRLAIGSGEFKGKGFMNGQLHILGHVPKSVAPSDLIFSVISEEGGFLVSSGLLLAYLILIFRCFHIAYLSDDDLGTFICAGIGVIIFSHVTINVGMNLGVTPTVGIPLPFISYGGSAILGMFISLGLLQSVYRFRKIDLED